MSALGHPELSKSYMNMASELFTFSCTNMPSMSRGLHAMSLVLKGKVASSADP